MELDNTMHMLGLTLQVFFLDLILSGDNALVIAIVCRTLPEHLRKKAVFLGTGMAIVLRVFLTAIVGVLLQIPFLKIACAVLLLSIAIKLLLQSEEEEDTKSHNETQQLWSAISIIVMADLAMSLDNVAALAAIAQGSIMLLALGLAFSVPLLMYGSLFISRILNNYPLLVPAGASLLGWVAGQLAVSDPIFGGWVEAQAPGLALAVPVLCVAYVLIQTNIIREQSQIVKAPAVLRSYMADAVEKEKSSLVIDRLPSPRMMPMIQEETPVGRLSVSKDGMNTSPILALLAKTLLWIALIAGSCAMAWLLFHLFNQGLLPPPKPTQAHLN